MSRLLRSLRVSLLAFAFAALAASPALAQTVTISGAGLASANVTADYTGDTSGRKGFYYLWVNDDWSDAIEVSVDWNSASNRWEIWYGEDFPAPGSYTLLYVNPSTATPDPPAFGWELAPGGLPAWAPAPTLSGTVTLPVELVSFTGAADGDAVRLAWTTASETNNAGFAVLQHTGADWEEVAYVPGRGTTSERTAYTRTIAGLDAGTHRFRLRQVDIDGTATLSPVVEVVVGMEAAITLRPRGRGVEVAVRESQSVRVDLVNALGQRVAVLFEGPLSAGETALLDVPSHVAAGAYVVRLAGRTSTTAVPLVVAR